MEREQKTADYPVISSRKNQMIHMAAELTQSARARRETGLFVAEGARLCMDAAKSGVHIHRCFFTAAAKEKYAAYLAPILKAAAECYRLEEHVAERLSKTKHSQAVFCQCEIPLQPTEPLIGKTLVLDNIQDPANLGAAMRTAEALGMAHVVLLGAAQDPYAPKVLRASMGAVFRKPVHLFAQSEGLFAALRQADSQSYAAVAGQAQLRLGENQFPENSAVFIGNEGNGLLAETIRACGKTITIPMPGRGESLNAAAAAAILMWEMIKCVPKNPNRDHEA